MQKFAYFSEMLYFCTLILELTMKYIFTYLLLLVGLVSASASPIYAWESANRSQMQSQRIMRSGVAYSGTVYTPFDNTSPSEYHPVAAGQDQDASGGRHGHIRKGKITGPDTPPANQSPIGEPWILALFAAIMAGIIAIKHQIKQKQQTAKNIMTMQNNNIKSERMFKVCKRYVLRMFYVFMILFTFGVGQMWGAKGFKGPWTMQYWYTGDANTWTSEQSAGATINLGVMTHFNLKGCWVQTYSNADWTTSNMKWEYGYTDHSASGNYILYENHKNQDPGYWTYDNKIDFDVIGNAPNPVGQNTLWMRWILDDGYATSSTCYVNFTIPGFTTTSTSQTFDNTTVNSNSSKTISFGNHYGTTLASSSTKTFTGTNASEFSVTSITESNVTVRFSPTSDGDKSATLTITDAYGNTCTITLSGKTQRTVTYSKGTDGTGSNLTDNKVYNTTLTLRNSGHFTRTGYHQTAWNTNTNGTGGTSYALQGSYTSNSAITLYPTWTANQYTITLNGNGGTGHTSSVKATYNSSTLSSSITNPTRTGYNFNGWHKTNGTGLLIINTSGALQANTDYTGASGIWTSTSGQTLWAGWTANNYTVTLDVEEDHHGDIASATTAVTATYDATMPSIATLPTAANGYKFWGFYSGVNGTGTRYYDESGNSVHTWDVANSTTILHAYYKVAEVTLALNHDAFEPQDVASDVDDKDYVIATPTISPTPEGDVTICWELLYENDNPVYPTRSAESAGGNAKKFSIVGLATGSYKVRATLHTGMGDCGEGATLHVCDAPFIIAGDHTINVLYKDADGNSISTSSTNPGKPLETTSITAPTITGYTFTKWKAGEGITIVGADASGEKASATISYYASFAGNLTAIYTKKKMIYFNNTLGWSDVYIYFYNSNKYWDNTYGSGAKEDQEFGDKKDKPYYEHEHGHMTRIDGTNIWYFDYTAEGVSESRQNVVFTESSQHNNQWFDNTKAVRLDNNFTMPLTMPMYVPLASPTVDKNVHSTYKTVYYTQGYWMNYPLNPGYTLKIYEGSTERYSVPFEYSADKTMPMPITVELNEATTYNFKIVRNDGSVFGNNGTMKLNSSGDVGQTAWEFKTGKSNCQLKTASAGDYTFTLNYGEDASHNYNYLVGVHYPVAIGSFRILYKDLATWSQGSAHTASWSHPSRTIYKQAGAKDTVSFFVSVGSTPTMKFQYASAINAETGAVTWTDVTSGTINLGSWSSVLTEAGVYNFITEQSNPASTISVINVEPYDGEYYIRVDAVSGKWENYRTGADHRMTYSSFSESDDNAFGEKYSHYKTKWCPRGVNVKFVIANDYSPCISDTLIRDVGDPFANIWEGDGTRADGELKAQSYGWDTHPSSSETEDRYSANIRFMWNRKTNKISRAYVGSSTNKARKFLVLRANAEIQGEDEVALNDEGITNGVILQDKQNWMYEEILYITPGTKFKLFACYAEATPTEANAQYFRGHYASNDWSDSDNTVVLIGGSGAKQKARVIYDFKTNRLMAAWIPSGAAVSGTMDINADVLVEREHQEAAQYITFDNASSQLTHVKTVYGAMKFNRWILNNRQNSSDDDPEHGKTDEQLAEHHPPLAAGQQKSIYERSLYFISFPFDVKVSDIFGFGHYWDEWYLEYYDGLNRAKNGYWIDSPPNWKYVTPEMADTMVLRKYVGYILGLDLDFLQANNYNFWTNGISTIELFFPSTTNQETLKQTTVTIPALSDEYECKINRDNGEGDRRVKDSYWRCIGTPSFNIYNTAISDGTGTITWKTDYTWKADKSEFPFIYMWNKGDNTLTAQSTSTFTFLPMHSYLVQNGKQIVWTNVSAKPVSPIVARKTNDMPETEYEWRLALMSDTNLIDQTFVRMTNLEQVTDSFDFGQDLSKEFNTARSNIYSYIGYERAAANSMTLKTETTTVIPLGLNIISAGEYTLAMPDGTHGVGVTLVDTQTNERTNLSAGMAQTVTLAQGDYLNRFFLEISPIHNAPTGIEEVAGNGLPTTGARKVLIDGILYIVKDGQLFDATGKRVE